MKTFIQNTFDNIGVTITNCGEGIDLNLIDKSRKKTYRKTLGGDGDIERNLNDDMIGNSIYVFSQIRYTKTKIYRRYIYIY